MNILDFFRNLFVGRKPKPVPPPPPKPLPTFEAVNYAADQQQTADIRRPENTLAGAMLRAIVMVHGGGFVNGDKSNENVWVNKAAHYVDELGLVLICPDYRLDVPPWMQAQDVAALVKFAQAHAKEWGIDPNRITLMGHSAGGTDVALAIAPRLCDVERVVLLDPASLDAVATMDHQHDAVFDPLGATREEWERNSPIVQLSGPTPPTFIAVSNARGKAFMQQVQGYADLAIHYGCPAVTVKLYPDLDHEGCNTAVGLSGDLTRDLDKFLGL